MPSSRSPRSSPVSLPGMCLVLSVPSARSGAVHLLSVSWSGAPRCHPSTCPQDSPWLLRTITLYSVAPGTLVQLSRGRLPDSSMSRRSDTAATGASTPVREHVRHTWSGTAWTARPPYSSWAVTRQLRGLMAKAVLRLSNAQWDCPPCQRLGMVGDNSGDPQKHSPV